MDSASQEPRPKWRTYFEVSATTAMVVVAGLMLWINWPASQAVEPAAPRVPAKPIATGVGPSKGSSSAKVGVVQFSEFECTFCGKAARSILKILDEKYIASGKVRFVFKNFPIPKHTFAQGAAAAAMCAADEAKFWEMHDLLFANQDKLAEADLRGYGATLHLDLSRFDSCRRAETTAATIQRDAAEGKAIGVTGTPTFYFGILQADGRLQVTDVLIGARPVAEFDKILSRLLGS